MISTILNFIKKWKELIAFLSMLGSVIAGIYAFVTYEKIVKINQIADRKLIVTGKVINNYELELKPSDPNQVLVDGMLKFPTRYSPSKISFTNDNNKVNLFSIFQVVSDNILKKQRIIQDAIHSKYTSALTMNIESEEILVPVYIEATFNAKNEKLTNGRLYFIKHTYADNGTKPQITLKSLTAAKEMSKEEAESLIGK